MDPQQQNMPQPGAQPPEPPVQSPIQPTEPSVQPPVQPMAPQPSVQSQPVTQPAYTPPQKPKNTKKIIGIIAGALGFLLIVVAVLLYFVWWQSPNKMTTDALLSVLTADKMNGKGSIVIDAPSSEVKLTIDTTGTTNGSMSKGDATVKIEAESIGEDISMNMSGVLAEDGTLYIKLDKLKQAVDSVIDVYVEQQADQYREMGYSELDISQNKDILKQQFYDVLNLDSIITQTDDQWMRITTDDLSEDEDSKCTADVLKDASTDKKLSREILAIYDKNRFIQVKEKVDAKDGAPGFRLMGDRDKAKSFIEEFKETEVAKRLAACDSEIFDSVDELIDDKELSSDTDFDFVIWVNRLSHKLESIQINLTEREEKTSISLVYDLEIGKANEIEIPSDARDFKEVFESIQSSLQTIGVGAESDSYYDYEYETYDSYSQFEDI